MPQNVKCSVFCLFDSVFKYNHKVNVVGACAKDEETCKLLTGWPSPKPS